MVLAMEKRYFPDINTVFVKPIGHLNTRVQIDELVAEFKKIDSEFDKKFWIISDISDFMIESITLVQYFAKGMMGLDAKRHGTIFILQDVIRKTGINLLRYYRRVNFYTAFDLESAMEIVKKHTEKGNS